MKVILTADGEGTFHWGELTSTRKCALFPNKKRGEFDTTHTSGEANGQTIKGIYKIEGDKLTCCYAEPGTARPTKFDTTGGSGLTLYVLRRVKR